MVEKWDLLFTLPNLAVPIETPFESDGYAICSGNQPWTDPPQVVPWAPQVYVKVGSAFDLSGIIRMNCNPQPRVHVTVVVPAGDSIVSSKSALGA
jgi:hypothetical protein